MHDGNIGNNFNLDVDAGELDGILDELAGMQLSVTEANGSLRARIKEVLESRGWHKTALSMVRQIEDMSETKRADFLRTFEPMFEAMLETKWRAEQRDILDPVEE